MAGGSGWHTFFFFFLPSFISSLPYLWGAFSFMGIDGGQKQGMSCHRMEFPPFKKSLGTEVTLKMGWLVHWLPGEVFFSFYIRFFCFCLGLHILQSCFNRFAKKKSALNTSPSIFFTIIVHYHQHSFIYSLRQGGGGGWLALFIGIY